MSRQRFDFRLRQLGLGIGACGVLAACSGDSVTAGGQGAVDMTTPKDAGTDLGGEVKQPTATPPAGLGATVSASGAVSSGRYRMLVTLGGPPSGTAISTDKNVMNVGISGAIGGSK